MSSRLFGILAEEKAKEVLAHECIMLASRAELEVMHVIKYATRFIGWRYARNLELQDGEIDCSTLTSQSFWSGAGIAIPFIAEKQRLAKAALIVNQSADIAPSDVFVRYTDLSSTPDGLYNHVGMYIGRDKDNVGWILEAASQHGVCLTPLDEFPPEGGIRRFAIAPSYKFDWQCRTKAQVLALHVPKLGRLGVPQLFHDAGMKGHLGLDIYVPKGQLVYAMMSGRLLLTERGYDISISNDERKMLVNIIHCEPFVDLSNGDFVQAGEPVGVTCFNPERENRVWRSENEKKSHLHVEWAASNDPWVGWKSHFVNVPFMERKANMYYCNWIYAIKCGIMKSPLDWSAVSPID